ncbi:hypothetical protein C4K04_4766 [Pseudomonas chlororaphis]|uniref:Uncharacterized protein n=1 Tax=Pseudomonas chlororaphis TaxID=587753 RepID=A0A3G7TU38_9PSED|nr:hypothetical protein C4K04_4766 [Pseudomonas chlororaphis]
MTAHDMVLKAVDQWLQQLTALANLSARVERSKSTPSRA